MFSGKSTAMLMLLDRMQRQGRVIKAFKPAIDDRYDPDMIVTHNDKSWPSVPVGEGAHILEHLAKCDDTPDVIAVDEAFMIRGVAEVLEFLFVQGATIIVSSLDLSYKCQPFAEIQKMMPLATRVEKLTAVCAVTGRDARYTYRTGDNDNVIAIGGGEMYEPRCWGAHPWINGTLERK
jgi:thymidine kinase